MKYNIVPADQNVVDIFNSIKQEIREDYQSNDYIEEAKAVFKIGAMRSAITQFWNAVIHDLREKVIIRSLDLFKKEMNITKSFSDYEGIQKYITDYDLIEGSYKIGILDRESRIMLHQSREVRNLFGAHPYSSRPDPVKTINMMMDCVRYVLSQPNPSKIINLDDYINKMQEPSFDLNDTIIVNNFANLPKIYKFEYIKKIHKAYIHKDTPLTFISNIEYVLPLIMGLCDKDIKRSIASDVSTMAISGDIFSRDRSLKFSDYLGSLKYLTHSVKLSIIKPLVDNLADNLDNFSAENNIVSELEKFSDNIPLELAEVYVSSITNTFVGRSGNSLQWSRTDFFANGAAVIIPGMFEKFSSEFIDYFANHIKTNQILLNRIKKEVKLLRLGQLCSIVVEKSVGESKKVIQEILDRVNAI